MLNSVALTLTILAGPESPMSTVKFPEPVDFFS